MITDPGHLSLLSPLCELPFLLCLLEHLYQLAYPLEEVAGTLG